MSITKEELDSFTSVLFRKFGLDFTGYEPQSLTRRINKVLHVLKYGSLHDLWAAILKNPELIHTFMDEISVGLTSMFRDPMVWSKLRSILYNNFKKHEKIRIWNAGCSTGEEVYTIAIILCELNMLDKALILATDMNKTALQSAKDGVYHKLKIIDYEKHYRTYNSFGNFSRYYSTKDANHYIMNQELIRNVTFQYHNLITDPIRGNFDIILCRNVMIYFDIQAKKRLLEKFRASLNNDGLFITGFFDSMLSADEKEKFHDEHSAARIFRIKEYSSESA